MGNTRTQRLAKQIRDEQGISYTQALGIARKQIAAEHAAADVALEVPARGAPNAPATTLLFVSPDDGRADDA